MVIHPPAPTAADVRCHGQDTGVSRRACCAVLEASQAAAVTLAAGLGETAPSSATGLLWATPDSAAGLCMAALVGPVASMKSTLEP